MVYGRSGSQRFFITFRRKTGRSEGERGIRVLVILWQVVAVIDTIPMKENKVIWKEQRSQDCIREPDSRCIGIRNNEGFSDTPYNPSTEEMKRKECTRFRMNSFGYFKKTMVIPQVSRSKFPRYFVERSNDNLIGILIPSILDKRTDFNTHLKVKSPGSDDEISWKYPP